MAFSLVWTEESVSTVTTPYRAGTLVNCAQMLNVTIPPSSTTFVTNERGTFSWQHLVFQGGIPGFDYPGAEWPRARVKCSSAPVLCCVEGPVILTKLSITGELRRFRAADQSSSREQRCTVTFQPRRAQRDGELPLAPVVHPTNGTYIPASRARKIEQLTG